MNSVVRSTDSNASSARLPYQGAQRRMVLVGIFFDFLFFALLLLYLTYLVHDVEDIWSVLTINNIWKSFLKYERCP